MIHVVNMVPCDCIGTTCRLDNLAPNTSVAMGHAYCRKAGTPPRLGEWTGTQWEPAETTALRAERDAYLKALLRICDVWRLPEEPWEGETEIDSMRNERDGLYDIAWDASHDITGRPHDYKSYKSDGGEVMGTITKASHEALAKECAEWHERFKIEESRANVMEAALVAVRAELRGAGPSCSREFAEIAMQSAWAIAGYALQATASDAAVSND